MTPGAENAEKLLARAACELREGKDAIPAVKHALAWLLLERGALPPGDLEPGDPFETDEEHEAFLRDHRALRGKSAG